jgi:prepilin-type N-terminal cleavage/methylation domain-containing protein/prepilin-type processing-associated H-X9-DG protein
VAEATVVQDFTIHEGHDQARRDFVTFASFVDPFLRADEMKRSTAESAFTLVELLVVITIIGILIALLLPAVQAAREAARRMQCGNNFRQVGVALHNYHAAKGCFPPGNFETKKDPYKNAPGAFSWSVYLLPYVEQQAVYDLYTFGPYQPTYYWSPANNATASSTRILAYTCPSDPVQGTLLPGEGAVTDMCGVSDSVNQCYPTDYFLRLFPAEVDGIFGSNECCTIADVLDGTSNTLIVGEVTGGAYPDGSPVGFFWPYANVLDTLDGINGPFTMPGSGKWPAWPYDFYSSGFASWHPGGCNFALADGSATFISQNVASDILQALTTRDGTNRRSYTIPATERIISGPP